MKQAENILCWKGCGNTLSYRKASRAGEETQQHQPTYERAEPLSTSSQRPGIQTHPGN